VTIKGTMVMINSGGSAGSGSGASPIAAKAAKEAIKSTGGKSDQAPEARPKPKEYSPQASSFLTAAKTGAPFCAVCQGC
jgi:type VI secretion system secreted protein VgrG